MTSADAARSIVARYLRHEVSAPIAALHLASAFDTPENAGRFLEGLAETVAAGSSDSAALTALRTFLQEHAEGFGRVRKMGLLHEQSTGELATRGVDAVRDLYDALASIDPTSAVALYAFGDAEVLDAASTEVVAYLESRRLLTPATRLLEIGCGIGRLLAACGPRCLAAAGLDISPAMVALATQRTRELPNVQVSLGTGLDLGPYASRSTDLVMAVDSWPHVVMLGEPAPLRLGMEVARVLVPGGEFVVLNLSYRDDPALDATDLARLAAECGFEVVEAGTRPFRLWDAAAFRLRRTGG